MKLKFPPRESSNADDCVNTLIWCLGVLLLFSLFLTKKKRELMLYVLFNKTFYLLIAGIIGERERVTVDVMAKQYD